MSQHPWIFGFFLLSLGVGLSAPDYAPCNDVPDAPKREFRGVWVTTVHNVDWPSREGLSVAEQTAEFLAIVDRCQELKLNAVILQVRSQCDAIWPSKIEPWSDCFTGKMGENPGYDPLTFALEETHRRGMELHAWFNPFRVINSQHVRPCKSHLAISRKTALSYYGNKVWLDPTRDFPKQRAIDVVKEVVAGYDVDAVHMDDYFYPYPIKNGKGEWRQFNDYNSWMAYKNGGGELSRGDWRREHLNMFVRDLRAEVKGLKPWVKFGISPFGIYRPGQPAQVKNSLDSYASLYTDVLLWWQEGWVDYLAPQLYWSTTDPQLGFGGLYQWWRDENHLSRHLWPGIATYRIKTEQRSALESLRQVKIARTQNNVPHGSGHIHFSMNCFMDNVSNINAVLKNNAYLEPALVPESPWLIRNDPPVATLSVAGGDDRKLELSWEATAAANNVRWWVVQIYEGGRWKTVRILPKNVVELTHRGLPEKIAVTPVGLAGELGKPATLLKQG